MTPSKIEYRIWDVDKREFYTSRHDRYLGRDIVINTNGFCSEVEIKLSKNEIDLLYPNLILSKSTHKKDSKGVVMYEGDVVEKWGDVKNQRGVIKYMPSSASYVVEIDGIYEKLTHGILTVIGHIWDGKDHFSIPVKQDDLEELKIEGKNPYDIISKLDASAEDKKELIEKLDEFRRKLHGML